MLFLLDAIDPNKELTLGDVFINGGKWFLLGMMTVFAVLGLIWITIELFHRCFAPQKKTPGAPSAKPVNALPTAPVSAPKTTVTAPTASDDEEIIAVIAAAIAAAEADTPNGLFRVVSFRKR